MLGEYARNFVEHGIFRLCPLSYYTKIESESRKDKGEGEGIVVVNMNRPVLTLDKKSRKILSQKMRLVP